MGINKELHLAQSELEIVNQDVNMSEDEYFEQHKFEKPTEQLLEQKKALEADVKELSIVADRFNEAFRNEKLGK